MFNFSIFLGLIALVFVIFFAPGAASYVMDSMIYVTTAEQFFSGHGLISTNFGLTPVEKDFIPLTFYPPGFPFLITFFRLLGLNEVTSAVFIPGMCFVLLPAAFCFVFRRISSPQTAMIIAFLSTFMAITVQAAFFALSDVPYLLFSLISLGVMIEGIEKESNILSFVGGLLVGFSVLVRLMGGALVIGVLGGLLFGAGLKILPKKLFWRLGINFCLGCAVVLIPYAWRNWIVSQSVMTFSDLPAHVSLLLVIKKYCEVMATLFFGDGQHVFSFSLLLLILIGFICIRFKTFYARIDINKKKIVYGIMLVVYFVAGSVTIMVMISKYNFILEERYLLQYSWIIVAAVVTLAGAALKKIGLTDKGTVKIVAGLLILVFFLIQAFPAMKYYLLFHKRNGIFQKLKSHEEVIRAIPDEYLIVTNAPDALQLLTRRNVRMLHGHTPLGLEYFIGNQKKFAVVLLLDELYSMETWRPILFGRIPYSYGVLFSDGQLAILVHNS